ncbi:hypothetical protein AB07_3926 [Citrobacter freundii]|nr:hypothetical protein AB07_3926 [Citrobacter freundii]
MRSIVNSHVMEKVTIPCERQKFNTSKWGDKVGPGGSLD